jgi:hypothetical protein
MNERELSSGAQGIIKGYKDFAFGNSVCSIPYFNNKTIGIKGALNAEVGKGSLSEINDEIKNLFAINKIDLKTLDSIGLKKFLVDNNIGIDCSGYAYYVLNEESLARGKGGIGEHVKFTNAGNFFRKIRARMMPVKNIDVVTFANTKNSHTVTLSSVEPGDIITVVSSGDARSVDSIRNHVLVIYKTEYENNTLSKIHYTHAVAWPTDGEYGHGIHMGSIRILDTNKTILDQKWGENDMFDMENYTYARAMKSQTEIRRLNWF